MRGIAVRQGLLATVLATGLCAGWAGPSAAQWRGPEGEPTEAELGEARELYRRGTEAVESHRPSEAVAAFERSYALSGASVALYSLAYTLQVLGRYREARDAFDQLLREHGELEPSIASDARRLRAEVAGRVAILSLAGLPEEGAPTVLLDGERVPDPGERPLSVETDPGLRALRVEAAGFEPFTWRGELAAGDRLALDVAMEPIGGSITDSSLFWIAIGATILTVGVITGVILYDNAQLQPRSAHHITL